MQLTGTTAVPLKLRKSVFVRIHVYCLYWQTTGNLFYLERKWPASTTGLCTVCWTLWESYMVRLDARHLHGRVFSTALVYTLTQTHLPSSLTTEPSHINKKERTTVDAVSCQKSVHTGYWMCLLCAFSVWYSTSCLLNTAAACVCVSPWNFPLIVFHAFTGTHHSCFFLVQSYSTFHNSGDSHGGKISCWFIKGQRKTQN